MKKTAKLFAVGAFVAAAAFSLSACSVFGYNRDGNYPYDIAVQGGYTGTEAEWLSEQETPETIYRRLYDEAKEDGSFTGTYFDFLRSLNLREDATPYLQRALLSVVSITCRFPSSRADTVVTSSGAGVIIDLDKAAGDAYILTNYHVLFGSASASVSSDISVYLYGNERSDGAMKATYFGGAMEYDLALLEIDGDAVLRASEAQAAAIGDSDSVIAGERVFAVGNPLNETLSVSGGIVSVEEQWLTLKAADETTYMTLPEIRIDASVNHGNSGGALFNEAGELVGIVNARDTRDEVLGFGYAIPVNFAMAAAENLLANKGELVLVQDGLTLDIESSKAVYDEALGRTHISEKICVRNYTVGAGSAAHIKQGDTLVSGYVVRNGESLHHTQFTRLGAWRTFLFKVREGDVLTLTVSREGKSVVLQATLTTAHFSVVH